MAISESSRRAHKALAEARQATAQQIQARTLITHAHMPNSAVRKGRAPGAGALFLGLGAEVQQQIRDVDLYGANLAASPAERRSERQFLRFAEAGKLRRHQRADRPAIDPSVSVAADLAIDRTSVQASAAPDTVQHLAHLGVRQGRDAAIVNQHHVHFVRAVFPRAARPGQQRRVSSQFLPRPERPRTRRKTPKSAKRGINFSIPTSAMCTRGAVVHMRMFPSFST